MRNMNLFALAFLFPALAFGSLTTCSNDQGDGLLMSEWQYGGGPPPPPEVVTARGRVHYRGILLDEWEYRPGGSGKPSLLTLTYDSPSHETLVTHGPLDNRIEVYQIAIRVARADGKPLLPDGTQSLSDRLTCMSHRQIFP